MNTKNGIRSTAAALTLGLLLSACANSDPAPATRMIDIGPHALHTRVVGRGAPAVVIDVGIASRSDAWHALQDRLADDTLVVVYDRAGYGSSETGPFPRDSGTEVDELKALLDALSVPEPYVLVGHSLGALNMQVFASRYPAATAGMVLLDPPPLGWLLGERFPELRVMAEQMTDAWQRLADRDPASAAPDAPFFAVIASEHREMFGRSARLADAASFGSIPLIVIGSDVPNPMFGDAAAEYQAYWIEQSTALAARSDRGVFVLAEGSTHALHEDAPELVLGQIRYLLPD